MELIPSNIKIFHTHDYSIFKSQQGNRVLISSDVKKVESKILENNLLKYHPILVSSDFNVIDGQHRLEVAKKNNLELYFIIMEEASSLKTTQSINTTGKPWTVKDFLKCYVSLGVESYIRFNDTLNEYKFLTVSQLISISAINHNNMKLTELFKSGKMKLKNEESIRKILSDIQYYDASSIRLSKNSHFQRFIAATNQKGIEFDHKRMLSKIELNIDIVKRIPNNAKIYSEVLGDIYNHKLAKSNKINFNLRAIK